MCVRALDKLEPNDDDDDDDDGDENNHGHQMS